MTDTPQDADDLRRRLQEIETEIAQLRGDEAGLNADLGTSAGPRDEGDIAAVTNNLEETEALLRTLEQRRDSLRAKLGES